MAPKQKKINEFDLCWRDPKNPAAAPEKVGSWKRESWTKGKFQSDWRPYNLRSKAIAISTKCKEPQMRYQKSGIKTGNLNQEMNKGKQLSE